MTENLWKKGWIEFWRSPIRVRDFFISPAFLLRVAAVAWFVLILFALTKNVLPTQQKSWALWMPPEDRELANNTALCVTFGSFLIVTLVQACVRIGQKVVAGVGGALAIMLLVFSLLGAFNYYSYANAVTAGASVTISATAIEREAEAKKNLDDHRIALAEELRSLDAQIALVPANFPTGKSRLLNQRTAASSAGDEKTKRLEATLAASRVNRDNTVIKTGVDTRPVDAFIARLTGFKREDVANGSDLMRSAVFELMIIIGAPLSITIIIANLSATFGAMPVNDKPPALSIPEKEKKRTKRINQIRVRAPTDEELAEYERMMNGAQPDPIKQPDDDPLTTQGVN